MNKNYIIKNKDIVKVLKKYEEFNDTFNRFLLKYKNYIHTVEIDCEDDVWICKINVQNESDKNKVFKETIRSSPVL